MPSFKTSQGYREFIEDKVDEITDDLLHEIVKSAKGQDTFKGYQFGQSSGDNTQVVFYFKDGIGIKVTVEVDHLPNMED